MAKGKYHDQHSWKKIETKYTDRVVDGVLMREKMKMSKCSGCGQEKVVMICYQVVPAQCSAMTMPVSKVEHGGEYVVVELEGATVQLPKVVAELPGLTFGRARKKREGE